jgi:TPP-dependent pyruvate/acetoin dehydrogenase alpha subunit
MTASPHIESLFETMTLIREAEEQLLVLFSQGKIFGTTHTCVGQEAVAAGVLAHLTPADVVFSNHRCHGHYLAFTGDVAGLLSEVMGKATGVCGGQGGSQHLCRGNIYTNGVLGSIVPNAVGIALAEKRQGRGSVTVVFIGDGALGEGVIYESLNLASLWGAPVLFVIENNHYAQSTPQRLQLAGRIADRPRAFGIETVELAAQEVEVVHKAAGEIVQRIRTTQTPACLVLDTYRLNPHSKGDDVRDKAEIEAARERDPLRLARAKLPAAVAEAIEARCRAKIAAAVERALADPFPEPASLPAGIKSE